MDCDVFLLPVSRIFRTRIDDEANTALHWHQHSLHTTLHTSDTGDAVTHGHHLTPYIPILMSMVVNHSSDLMCVQRPYLIHKQLNSLSTNIHGTVDTITHSTQEPVTCHRLRIFCRPAAVLLPRPGPAGKWKRIVVNIFLIPSIIPLQNIPRCAAAALTNPDLHPASETQPSPAQPQPTPRVHILRLN